MHEIKAIVRPDRLDDVLTALHGIADVPGATVSKVRGYGRQIQRDASGLLYGEVVMNKIEIVVAAEQVEVVVRTIEAAANTGHAGDGKIFVSDVREAITIHKGARGSAAL